MATKERLSLVANIAVIGLVAFALLRPSGPIGLRISLWYDNYTARRIVAREWTSIAATRRVDLTQRPVAIVEFSDYECPFCRKQHVVLTKVLADPRAGGLAFRHLPLAIHEHADGAARTAICAEKQGRFVAMHNRLFTTDKWMTDTNWTREALEAGITDTSGFRKCRTSEETSALLREDMRIAERLNIRGTPAFVASDKVHVGGLPDTTYFQFGTRLTR